MNQPELKPVTSEPSRFSRRRPVRPRGSHLISAAIGSGVLYYVLKLSAGDRGTIDWVVIGLVSASILWNLSRAARGGRTGPPAQP